MIKYLIRIPIIERVSQVAIITKKLRGTEDVLPQESYRWQFLEKIMREQARVYGFSEIRTPVFENTQLFSRGVGETTDVVQKEMYTFETKGGESVTLRPEGTAGAARALLEHGVYNDGLPVKASYFVSCYRYEKPQAGRLREFHQFGLEVYGTSKPIADAELICAAASVFERLGIDDLHLEINSIGCPRCREKYHAALKEYFTSHEDQLCDTCKGRLERNPMRILDCKSKICSSVAADAPVILDYLCEECKEHFDGVKSALDSAGMKYTVNPRIVRGLDYYTKTVFEFVSGSIGAQSTVCGGGRYDGLIEELGGQPLPSLGFALGMERLLLLMDSRGIEIPRPEPCAVYVAALGEKAEAKAFGLVKALRESSFHAQYDIVGRGLKAQMKYANKIGALYCLVIGDNEIEENKAMLKNMTTGEQLEISLGDDFISRFTAVYLDGKTGSPLKEDL